MLIFSIKFLVLPVPDVGEPFHSPEGGFTGATRALALRCPRTAVASIVLGGARIRDSDDASVCIVPFRKIANLAHSHTRSASACAADVRMAIASSSPVPLCIRTYAESVGLGQPSYDVEWVDGGSKKKATFWIVNAKAPKIYPRHVELQTQRREAMRPSKVAKVAGHRSVRSALIADGAGADDWEDHDEYMPDENEECDVSWQPGPISRDLPAFTGLAKG